MAAMAISQSSSVAPDSGNAKGAAASIFSILDGKSKIDPSDESGMTLDSVKGEIQFQNVSFAYPTRLDIQIFRDLCLSIRSGKTVALVGESGSGKSTIISLLQRFMIPTQIPANKETKLNDNMVARKFVVYHENSIFDVDYDADDGFEVLQFQLFSLTSVPPDQQKILGGEDDRIVSDDSDLSAISDKLRVVHIHDEEEKGKAETELTKSDEELARMLQAEEEALMMQNFVANENKEQIEQRIRPYIYQVLQYEDILRQDEARKTVPVDKLEEKAILTLAREGNFEPSKSEQDHAFLLQLLLWFKQSFRWVNAPPCDSCGKETVNEGMGVANPSETRYGASRVELYRCKSCSSSTRFPRYNDPLKLLETRKGRCGEWANCFTLYCRAFNYESRLILDFTDHVWTECFSPSLGRWIHLDPCEGIYDNPLLYEKGWKKKLNYVIAIARDGVYDVTKRYTKNWHEVLSRRNLTTESSLSLSLSNMTKECRKSFTSEVLSSLEERDRYEIESLEGDLYSKDDVSISLPGRQSGDKLWRMSRSEFGSDSLGSSSCPVRTCVDEHVTKICNSFFPVISKLVDHSVPKFEAAEIIMSFRKILVELKNSPFKNRRTSIDAVSHRKQFTKFLPSFSQLFDALSLKTELVANDRINIRMASDPVKTSIALPVVFHALDDLIYNVKYCNKLDKSSLSWPLLKLNRICNGLVLASGEELPFGIATSAFDGTRMSKWEEPNGGTGCWIVYQVFDNQMHDLLAYELMSANDAPERDPRDWIKSKFLVLDGGSNNSNGEDKEHNVVCGFNVDIRIRAYFYARRILEGSQDGGLSWHVLDKQTSQIFEERFQRKIFKIVSPGFLANAFRLRFTAVRDTKATSRFQIGSIDLYSMSNLFS